LSSASAWTSLRDELGRKFRELAPTGAAAGQAMEFLDEWLSKPIYQDQRESILAHAEHQQFPLLLDCFYQLVPFGTGGRRGRVGFGPNRINPITVAMSVQGHCDFLRKTNPDLKDARIVIAFDTREFNDLAKTYAFLGESNTLLGVTSRSLAQNAAEIYSGNGFQVTLAGLNAKTEYLSTPELSFAIRHLDALGGMNVSASHNPPDDNGFKFFNEQGAQDIPPTDQEMTTYMGSVTEIKRIAFEEARGKGLIKPLPDGQHKAYIETNLALQSKPAAPLPVVYTPLCGTGDGTVGDVLRAAGFEVHLYQPHANHDGSFSAIPFRLPNPEVPEAASPAFALAKETGADLLLSTDPDADRIGVFAKDAGGRWRYLNGNEIASILAYYLVGDPELGPHRKGVLIKTLVTTRTIEKIAAKAGCSIVSDLLVGFKYIANVLLCLEREGRFHGIQGSPGDLVLAGEESHGVLLTPKIRDKDAAGGALILCELAAQLRARGRRLPEYLDALSMECGNHQNLARGVVMRGIRGAKLLADMMGSLRENPPARFGEFEVLKRRDLLTTECGPLRTETERLSRNLLVFETAEAQIVVRPSGTEPKAKIYVDVEGGKRSRQEAAAFARKLSTQVMEECIGRIGFQLSESAHRLPDTVDLDLKAEFDTGVRKDLLASAGKLAEADNAARLQWLRDRLRAYGGGADPLEPTAGALEHLLDVLAKEAGQPPLAEALRSLAQTVAAARTPADWVM